MKLGEILSRPENSGQRASRVWALSHVGARLSSRTEHGFPGTARSPREGKQEDRAQVFLPKLVRGSSICKRFRSRDFEPRLSLL